MERDREGETERQRGGRRRERWRERQRQRQRWRERDRDGARQRGGDGVYLCVCVSVSMCVIFFIHPSHPSAPIIQTYTHVCVRVCVYMRAFAGCACDQRNANCAMQELPHVPQPVYFVPRPRYRGCLPCARVWHPFAPQRVCVCLCVGGWVLLLFFFLFSSVCGALQTVSQTHVLLLRLLFCGSAIAKAPSGGATCARALTAFHRTFSTTASRVRACALKSKVNKGGV